MELRHIRYFLAVADEGNFTRAARGLGIGQPPLSSQIRDLEAEVGAQLFHRVPHGAELTEAGRAFRDAVSGLPALTTRATRLAQRAARGETGAFRLGYTGSAALNRTVPFAVRAFRRAFPAVDLSLREENSALLIDAVAAGTLDAAFLRSWDRDATHLQIRRLSEEPVVLVLPESHPAAPLDVVELAAVRDDRLLLTPRRLSPDYFDAIVAACRASGFEPDVDETVPQMTSAIGLVAAEMGVSFVPSSMAQLGMSGVVYRSIAGGVPVAPLSFAHRRGDMSTILRNFLGCAFR